MTRTMMAHYELGDKIGAGGMGEVFRARDTKLGREVAIKVLPAILGQDTERLTRFQREAMVLASLNHPNIATLYGLEEHEGAPFLVMELVDGEDLHERLRRGPLPVDEALAICRSVAEALATAHDQGIVHRDLKPANVKLTAGGDVKVLDFGLAKAFESDPALGDISHSPTIMASSPTMAGVILGTAAYMSPEQARGKPLDKRTDIWAFGCLFFELLTGRQAFPGETVSDTIAKILEREPDWERLPDNTPVAIQRLMRRCVTKDQKKRLQDIGDARNEIDLATHGDDPLSSGISIAQARAFDRPAAASAKPPILWMALSAIFLIASIVATIGYFGRSGGSDGALYRAAIPSEPMSTFVTRGDFAGPIVISPDGQHVAFVARAMEQGRLLWVRDLDQPNARAIPGSEGATFPFWSADSRSVGFFADAKVKRVEIDGGLPITLCDADAGRGGAWSASGTILYSPAYRAPIRRVPDSGGESHAITALDSTLHSTHRWPFALPDGKHFLYIAAHHDVTQSENYAIHWAAIDGSKDKEILKTDTQGAYASGHLLHVRNNNLIAIPFDPEKGELTGDPVPLNDKVATDPTTWIANFSVSQNGVLVYNAAQRDASSDSRIAMYDRTGRETQLVDEDDTYYSLSLSPDDTRLAVTAGSTQIGVWIIDIERGLRKRATFDSNTSVHPQWSPDSEDIVYSTLGLATNDDTSRLFRVSARGGDPELLLEVKGDDLWATDWSPDGRYIVFSQGDYVGARTSDVWILPLDGGKPGTPIPRLDNEFSDYHGVFSPDGRWLAHTSNQSGRPEVYVIPFVDPTADGDTRRGQWQISADGGWVPRWNSDGTELYYVSLEDEVMVVKMNIGGDRVQAGQSEMLFPTNLWDLSGIGFDVTSDGQNFILNSFSTRSEVPATLVINWTRELTR